MEAAGRKRSIELESSDSKKRKSRFSEAPATASKISENEDKVAKLAALQESVKAQISSMSAVVSDRPNSIVRKARDFTLRLDEKGRQIDELGRVVDETFQPVATLKANVDAQKRLNNPYLAHLKNKAGDNESDSTFDPKLNARVARPKKAAFNFVKPGVYLKKAEKIRDHALAIEHRKLIRGERNEVMQNALKEKPTAMSLALATNNQKEVGKDFEAQPCVPACRDSVRQAPSVEWWDEPFIPESELNVLTEPRKLQSGVPVEEYLYNLATAEICRTVQYIQHPKPLKGAAGDSDKSSAPMSMYLTKAERKRVRRQVRAEKEREKRDKMALGLIPPPPPKMKLSNFMKVLGEQAVADPSKVEMMVQLQVQARKLGHEMRNQAGKLTPEERRAKRRAKLAADSSKELCAAVLRIADLSHPKHRYKIDANAQQYGITGCLIMCPGNQGTIGSGINVLIAEGGPNAMKRYLNLLTKRIRWTNEDFEGADNMSTSEDEESAANDANFDTKASHDVKKPCELVWQGTIMSRVFSSFRFQECKTSDSARKTLQSKGIPQYWDIAIKVQT